MLRQGILGKLQRLADQQAQQVRLVCAALAQFLVQRSWQCRSMRGSVGNPGCCVPVRYPVRRVSLDLA